MKGSDCIIYIPGKFQQNAFFLLTFFLWWGVYWENEPADSSRLGEETAHWILSYIPTFKIASENP